MILEFKDENRWLSNFWPVNVLLDGVAYPSVENAYQASKTLNTLDREYFTTCTPGQAKRRGRDLQIREDWEDVKIAIMRDLLILKFRDPILKDKLLATGDKRIREGNNWNDKFWGVCLKTGKGLNHLGNLITEIRENLKNN